MYGTPTPAPVPTNTPRPTATPRPPTATPTPIPSGTLSASVNPILVGQTTKVTYTSSLPRSKIKFSYSNYVNAVPWPNCDNSGENPGGKATTEVVTSDTSGEFTMRGCSAGSTTVRMRVKSGNKLLASVTIVVGTTPPTATPTPTPAPSGSLSASVEVVQYDITTVTASNLSPSGTSFKIAYPDTIRLGSTCSGGGGHPKATGTTRYTPTFTKTTNFTFRGCNLGAHTLKLLTSTQTGGSGLDTTTITVVTPTPTPTATSTPITPPPVSVSATMSRSDDDLTFSYGWSNGGGGGESTDSWSIKLRQSTTQNGTYSDYRNSTSSIAGSVSFNNVARGKWYKGRVTGCKGQNNCATVDTGTLQVPTPTPTPSGSLRATTTTITKGGSTSVEVHSVSPSNAALRIQYPGGLTNGNVCPSGQAGSSSVTQPADIHFNGPRTFTFTGCVVGTYTVKLLPKVGTTALDTISIRVEAQTTPPTAPKVWITKVLPGTTGVYVEFNWSPKRPDSLSKLTLSWGQTTGIWCSPAIPCNGSAALATSGPSATSRTADGHFVQDSGYSKFKIAVEGTWDSTVHKIEGHFRDNNDNDRSVRTQPTPKLMIVGDGRHKGKELGGVEWGMFDYVTVQVQSTQNSSGYDVALHVPAGTGLQLKTSETEPCTYGSTQPHVWPTPQLAYHPLGSRFALVRCSLGDGVTDLTFVGRVREGNNAYSVGSYAEVENVRQSWHQADHSVTYFVRGTHGEDIRATSTNKLTSMFPLPLPGDVVNKALYEDGVSPYDNAAAAWTGVNAECEPCDFKLQDFRRASNSRVLPSRFNQHHELRSRNHSVRQVRCPWLAISA